MASLSLSLTCGGGGAVLRFIAGTLVLHHPVGTEAALDAEQRAGTRWEVHVAARHRTERPAAQEDHVVVAEGRWWGGGGLRSNCGGCSGRDDNSCCYI